MWASFVGFVNKSARLFCSEMIVISNWLTPINFYSGEEKRTMLAKEEIFLTKEQMRSSFCSRFWDVKWKVTIWFYFATLFSFLSFLLEK